MNGSFNAPEIDTQFSINVVSSSWPSKAILKRAFRATPTLVVASNNLLQQRLARATFHGDILVSLKSIALLHSSLGTAAAAQHGRRIC